jgi:uncharacterized protein YndB with AHSA1/START domain
MIVLGVAALTAGLVLFATSLRRFAVHGMGTLAPWDPPRRLVVQGPYRYVRNPMISGVNFVVFGEALVLRSAPHALWASVFLLANMIWIPLVEEPQLAARFGADYREYCRHVRRFLPRLRPWVGGLLLLLLPAGTTAARADVLDAAANGFTVQTKVTIAAPRDRVYLSLVRDVGRWWDREHTWSGDAANLSIDPSPGGCFCERLRTGGIVEHLRVVYADQGRLLRMTGGLGPLQSLGVSGSMTWALEDAIGATTLTMTYAVGGYAPGGLDALAKAVDGVVAGQVQRLKRYVERGNPAP